MEFENNKSLIRLVPNSEITVVYIHGILGSPAIFDFAQHNLIDNVSYIFVELSGHGGKVTDFSKARKKDWVDQINELIEILEKRNQKIIMVGQSMGCLLSIEGAIKSKAIKQIILISPPIYVHLPFSTMVASLSAVFRKNTSNKTARNIQNSVGVKLSKNLPLYLGWIPPFLALFSLIRDVKKDLNKLDVPATAYHIMKDELVSNKTYKYLLKYPDIKLNILNSSSHFGISEEDGQLINAKINEIIDEVKKD